MDNLPGTGKVTSFETGAIRDAMEEKGFPHMVPPTILRRLGVHFERGAKKYAKHNWMKGIPLSRYQDALMRHTLAWAEGDASEDHLAAIVWNGVCMGWTEEQIVKGNLPKDLNDLPYREEKHLTSWSS
jgi:hypothetical protein